MVVVLWRGSWLPLLCPGWTKSTHERILVGGFRGKPGAPMWATHSPSIPTTREGGVAGVWPARRVASTAARLSRYPHRAASAVRSESRACRCLGPRDADPQHRIYRRDRQWALKDSGPDPNPWPSHTSPHTIHSLPHRLHNAGRGVDRAKTFLAKKNQIICNLTSIGTL